MFLLVALCAAAVRGECVFTATVATPTLYSVARLFSCLGTETTMARLSGLPSALAPLAAGALVKIPDVCAPVNASAWPSMCAASAADCAENANGTCAPGTCAESPLAFTCLCPPGFQLSATAVACGRSGHCTPACELVPSTATPCAAASASRCASPGSTCQTSSSAAADAFVCQCPAGQHTMRTNRTVCERACADSSACGDAPNACVGGHCVCAAGFDLVDNTCVDLCSVRPTPCVGPTASCSGGRCRCGAGFELNPTGDACADMCGGSVRCFGSAASCRAGVCSCELGFNLVRATNCVDQCESLQCDGPTATCRAGFCACGKGHAFQSGTCVANPGCDKLVCIGGTCSVSAARMPFCLCPAGFEPDANSRCSDVDECAKNTHNCKSDQLCNNRNGTFVCTARPLTPVPPVPVTPAPTKATTSGASAAPPAVVAGEDNTTLIIGCVVGGVLLLAAVGVLVFLKQRRAAASAPPSKAKAAGDEQGSPLVAANDDANGKTFLSASSGSDGGSVYKPLTLTQPSGSHYHQMDMRPDVAASPPKLEEVGTYGLFDANMIRQDGAAGNPGGTISSSSAEGTYGDASALLMAKRGV
jgi:hypothetical protein